MLFFYCINYWWNNFFLEQLSVKTNVNLSNCCFFIPASINSNTRSPVNHLLYHPSHPEAHLVPTGNATQTRFSQKTLVSHYRCILGASQSLQAHRWVVFLMGHWPRKQEASLWQNFQSGVSLSHQLFIFFPNGNGATNSASTTSFFLPF